jgi:protein-tyrosine phosphatase
VIDTHCHVLPFIDDGAEDWEASLAMARAATADGIRQCIATPHWTGRPGETETLQARAEELRRRLDEAALPLKVQTGNEVVLVPRLTEALKEGRALTLAGSSYVLLETAQLEQGGFIHAALFQVQSQGYRIILAHPERVRTWQSDFADIRELLWRGCYLQVNAGSLAGGFGKPAQKAAEELIRLGWASLLATDSHSPNKRPPLLSQAVARCATLIGDEAAHALVNENPARVLCDEQLPYVNADSTPRRSRFSFPWWPRRS